MLQKVCLFLVLALLPVGADPAPQLPAPGGYEHYLEVAPDGSLVMLSGGSEIWLWDANSHRLIRKMQNFERVTDFRFSPVGGTLVVSDYPRWLACFDAGKELKKRWEFRDPWNGTGGVQMAGGYHVQFSPDGKYLLAIGGAHGAQKADHVVRLIETSSGKILREYPNWGGGRGGGSDRDFAFAPDSRSFVRTGLDKLQAYAVPSGEKIKEIRLGGNSYWLRPQEGGVLVSHTVDKGTRQVYRLYSVPALQLVHEAGIREASPRSKGTLQWSRATGKLQVLKGAEVLYQGPAEEQVRYWVPGGGFVLSVPSDDHTLLLYGADGQKLGSIPDLAQFKGPLALHVPGYGGPGEVINLLTGKNLAKFTFASSLAVSEDGQRLFAALKGGVFVADVPASLQQGRLVGAVAR